MFKEAYILDKIALILVIIGAIHLGIIGIFDFNLIEWLFGTSDDILSRLIYTIIGLSGFWSISFFFEPPNNKGGRRYV